MVEHCQCIKPPFRGNKIKIYLTSKVLANSILILCLLLIGLEALGLFMGPSYSEVITPFRLMLAFLIGASILRLRKIARLHGLAIFFASILITEEVAVTLIGPKASSEALVPSVSFMLLIATYVIRSKNDRMS